MENNTFCVYKHVFPNGKIYVGVTKNAPEYRWANGLNYQKNIRMTRAVKKYGWANIKHVIIASGLTKRAALDLEADLIRRLDTQNPEVGYNLSPGYNYPSNEGIEKTRQALKSKTGEKAVRARAVYQIEPVTMQVLKEYPTARMAAEELGLPSISAVSNACRRRDGNWSPCSHGFFWCYVDQYDPDYFSKFQDVELTASGRLPRTGDRASSHPCSAETKAALSDRNSKAVVCVETGAVFKNIRRAAVFAGVDDTAIGHAAKGKSKTSGGYHWRYVNYGDY